MASRTSYTQFTMMVEFMEKNGDLSKPQSVPNGRLWSIKKWKELTELLNSQGVGESRSEEKWRKVWSDFKNNTKKKWAKINRAAQGTGGGPALNSCLTDLEQRVLAIVGVQAAVGMPIPEIGFDMVEKVMDGPVLTDTSTDNLIIVPPAPATLMGDEDWNTPGSSKDAGPIPPGEFTLPSPETPNSIPPESPKSRGTPPPTTQPHQRKRTRNVTSPPTTQHKRKRKVAQRMSVEEYFFKSDENAREYARTRERMFLDLERERIRQRDFELHLQAQWLEFMKEALKLFAKHMDEKNVRE